MQVAIDGPASSGKSTISKILASKYSLTYLDTGAMYRAAAWLKLNHALTDEVFLEVLADTVFEFRENGKNLTLRYLYNGRPYVVDVTEQIRTPVVTACVGNVSADERVRKILTRRQQQIAGDTDVIMDGRDIGTVVLPNAELKFFLTASLEERAKRRTDEWCQKGVAVCYENVCSDLAQRDKKDSERQAAPLKKADDAVIIDTTCLTINEVTAIIGAAILKIKEGIKPSLFSPWPTG